MLSYLPWMFNGIAAILMVIGWRREMLWLVCMAQAIAQPALVLSLALLFA